MLAERPTFNVSFAGCDVRKPRNWRLLGAEAFEADLRANVRRGESPSYARIDLDDADITGPDDRDAIALRLAQISAALGGGEHDIEAQRVITHSDSERVELVVALPPAMLFNLRSLMHDAALRDEWQILNVVDTSDAVNDDTVSAASTASAHLAILSIFVGVLAIN